MERNKLKYQLRSRSDKPKQSCSCCSESSDHPRSLARYVKAREKRKLKVDFKDIDCDDSEQPDGFDGAVIAEDIIIGTPSPVIRSKMSKKRKVISLPYSRSVVGDNESSTSIVKSRKSKGKLKSNTCSIPIDTDDNIVSKSPVGQGSFTSRVSENVRSNGVEAEVDYSDDDDDDDDSFFFGMSALRRLGKSPTRKARLQNCELDDEDDIVGSVPLPTRRKKIPVKFPSSSTSTVCQSLPVSQSLNLPQPAWIYFNNRSASNALKFNSSIDDVDGPVGEQTSTRRSTLQFSPDLSFDRFRQHLLPRSATSTVASASLSSSGNMEISPQRSQPSASASTVNQSLTGVSISPPNSSLGDISISPLTTRLHRRVSPAFSSTPAATAATNATNTDELEDGGSYAGHISASDMDTDSDDDVICLDSIHENMSPVFSSLSRPEEVPFSTNPRRRISLHPALFSLAHSESPQVLETSTVSPATMRNIERIDQISTDEALARELQQQFNQETPPESQGMAAAAAAAAATSPVPLPNDHTDDETPTSPWPDHIHRRSENRRERVRNLVAQSTQILSQMNVRIGHMNSTLQSIEARRTSVSPPARGRRRSRSQQVLASELQNLDRQLQSIIQARQQRQSVVLRSHSRGRNNRTRIRFQHAFDHSFGPNNYEELLLLSEQMGPAVARGLSKTQLRQLPTYAFTDDNAKEDNTCNICFVDYEESEMLRRLPCFHRYHAECIDPWLKQNSTCPICRVEVKV